MSYPLNLLGTKDVGDCRGCDILFRVLQQLLPTDDEGVYKARAGYLCGLCLRKPEEVKKYNPAECITTNITKFDPETNSFVKIKERSKRLEDKWIEIGQSELQSQLQSLVDTSSGKPEYCIRDIPANALKRIDDFLESAVYI